MDFEERVPARHPFHKIRRVANDPLASMDAEFDRLYAADIRPSIAPERLLRASLIQILFSVRSERQLMEQLQYNPLFRWFVGLGIDDPGWVPTVFSKNRDRLLTTDIVQKFLAAILPIARSHHSCRTSFSVDATLIKAWASVKSFQPKPEQEAEEPGGGSDDPPALRLPPKLNPPRRSPRPPR